MMTDRHAPPTPSSRASIWLQLLIGWLPVWALYATIIVAMHDGTVWMAMVAASRAIGAAALLGVLVLRLTERLPWPRRMTLTFMLAQVGGAIAFSVGWVLLTQLIESVMRMRLYSLAPAAFAPFLLLGLWLYVAVAGVSYAVRATERAARAEAIAAQSQLAALRGQLNPHFLFNALHTVVQLIPVDPVGAGAAAEQIAGLLRSTIEEDRDLVPLRDEREFVERYVELERTRFGERLDVVFDVDDDTLDSLVPSFALQTLVENAVRHGAAPRVEPTRVVISAQRQGKCVKLSVTDDGIGAEAAQLTGNAGTGIRRLRERLQVLYGAEGCLDIVTSPGAGFEATMLLPQSSDD